MQKFQHFAYREVVKGRPQEGPEKYIRTKSQKVRTFGENMLGVLNVVEVTESADGIVLNVDNVVMTVQVVMTCHKLN